VLSPVTADKGQPLLPEDELSFYFNASCVNLVSCVFQIPLVALPEEAENRRQCSDYRELTFLFTA